MDQTQVNMNEFELRRQRKIAANQAVLASLLGDSPAESTPAPGPRKRKSPVDQVPGPTRRSRRLESRRGDHGEKTGAEGLEEEALAGEGEGLDLSPPISQRRAVKPSTPRKAKGPVVVASGGYRLICVRHPDGRYEEPGRETLGAGLGSPLPMESLGSTAAPTPAASPAPPAPARQRRLTRKEQDLEDAKVFGAIPGVAPGRWFPGRQQAHDAKLHRGLVAGIFGDEERGCFSVSVSGGYEDDVDEGDRFVFTGEGGRVLNRDSKGKSKNLRTAPQCQPQVMTKGNLALKVSCETGLPVRVIRGFKARNRWAPRAGYRYDGLYQVLKVWEDEGLSGFGVFRFALMRMPGQEPIDTTAGPGPYTEEELAGFERALGQTGNSTGLEESQADPPVEETGQLSLDSTAAQDPAVAETQESHVDDTATPDPPAIKKEPSSIPSTPTPTNSPIIKDESPTPSDRMAE